MTLLLGEQLSSTTQRTYNLYIPPNPVAAQLPAIVVFHGGGQDPANIARRWGVAPPNPVPPDLADYLLVFPVADARLTEEWVHYKAGDSAFPTLDLEFVRDLLLELTGRQYPTGAAGIPNVSADPNLLYAAGFSNGGGMVWQLLNSDLSSRFQGFAAVGKALDPEKAKHYRAQLAAVGQVPAAAPMFYLQGTADTGYRPPFSQHEVKLDSTLPFFTLSEMLDRNGWAGGAANTRFLPGSTNVTEAVLQLFVGAKAYVHGTVLNGGHNWPSPTTVGNPPVATHLNATHAIVEFWRQHANLP